ncbi:hypothetical protein [Mesorhizobium temperatum]|nr:hypothetical protein [Mesorhizobium temperatum]
MLLAVFLTAGFSLSAAQATIMSAKMATMTGMTMAGDAGMATDAASTMDSDCGACLVGADDNGNPMQCPPTCIAPVLAVLPQGLAATMMLRAQQPEPSPYPLLCGHAPLPDPSPPKPSDHA